MLERLSQYKFDIMDTEQTINNQPRLQDMGSPKETSSDVFKKTLETSQRTMNILVGFATENGIATERLSHVTRVFDPDGHILLPSIETMKSDLAKIYGEDRTMGIRAYMSGKTGQVFVPQERGGNVHDVFHESIHRAAWLGDRQRGLNTNTTDIIRKLASDHGMGIAEDGEIVPNIKFLTESLMEEVVRVTEGITEWTTRKARDIAREKGLTIEMADEDMVNNDKVQYVNKVRTRLIERGGLSDKTADAELIAAALTGNISELLPCL